MPTFQYKCYEIAATLSPVEWKRLIRECRKGIRCQHADTQSLVGLASDHYPDFLLEDDWLAKKVRPGEVISNSQLRVLRANFKKLLEAFIVEQALAEDVQLQNLLLMRGLSERGAYPSARSRLEKSRSQIVDAPLETRRLETAFQFYDQELDLYIRERQRTTTFAWGELIQSLDDFHLVRKLCLLCGMISSHGHLSTAANASTDSLENALAEAEAEGEQLHPLAAMYYHLLSLYLDKPATRHASALQDLLAAHGPQLASGERINIFGLQINLFLTNDLKGIPGSIERVWAVYQQMVDLDILFGSGSFSVNSARNIITLGARLGEVAWTRDFLRKAMDRLPQPEADNVYYYGSGYLDFVEGNYAAARRSLVHLTFFDPFYKMGHDILQLRINYEAGDVDQFSASHAVLLRHIYRKEGISQNIRQGLRNMLRVTERMFALRGQPFTQDDLQEVRDMVADCDTLVQRDWVMAKLGELEGAG